MKITRESLLRENPGAAAAAAMATIMLMNQETGRKNKAITALRDKDNPAHGKAVGIFQKLKDKFTQKKKERTEKQRRADVDVALRKMGITPKMETVNKLDESIKMRTVSGNKKFMTKTAIPIIRKYGVTNMKANIVGGYFLELSFMIDSNKLKQLDKELKRKNRTAYSGIIEKRRNNMTKSQLREMIREIIKEEDDAFGAAIPAAVDRYMKKFVAAVKGANLNRKKKITILGRTVVALGLDPSEVSKYARLVKKGL
jgi:Ca2+-binding EF-hand superfamily protein